MEVSARVARSVRCLGLEQQPAGAPVPARFVVVAAIRCIQSDQVVPGHGLWQFDLWQVAEHGLTRLDALRKSAASLLEAQGLRATSRGGHLAVQEVVTAQFGATVRVFRSFGEDLRHGIALSTPAATAPALPTTTSTMPSPSPHEPATTILDQNVLTRW